MADRQYALPSDVARYVTSSPVQSRALPQQSLRSMSPPKYSEVPPIDFSQRPHLPPAPPSGGSIAPSPPPHRSIVPTSRSHYPGDAVAIGDTAASGRHIPSMRAPDGAVQVLRDIDNLYNPRIPSPTYGDDDDDDDDDDDGPYGHHYDDYPAPSSPPAPRAPVAITHRRSQSSIAPLVANPASPGLRTPSPVRRTTASRLSNPVFDRHIPQSPHHHHHDDYDAFDPRDIADDCDDGFQESPPRQRSRMGFRPVGAVPGAAASGAAMGTGIGAFKSFASRGSSGPYGPLPSNGGGNEKMEPKSEWLEEQSTGKRRMKWIMIILGALLILGAVVGGIIGGVLASKSKSPSSSSSSSGASSASTGDLFDINSSEVQQLLNNKALHKVFPGMDYTPLNAQYPDCLSNPPDQNNITLDVAMLSQLTPAIRLYGTDCNATEMVLTAIDRLHLNDSMSVWLGVWLDNNQTTSQRQLQQMYDILNVYPTSHFAGVIVGNEVLFRKDLTLAQLSDTLTTVRSNLAAMRVTLPVATSDLGDNWTAGLAKASDIVMANVHPFFAGVTPATAPGWTWDFWQQNDALLAPANKGSYPQSIISETGWPSDGGNDCGTDSKTCASGQGAVASIDNMNQFMDGFVCQSLTNGTTYFWFEAFDEPWKVIFDTDSDRWESKWGLMDANRNLKDGLKIPDCGGKSVDKPY